MNLISIRKKRRPAIALLLCTGLLGACPPDAVADAGDRLPVPEIQQSKSPVKRTLVGTVTDASTGETLIGVNVIIKGTTQGTVTDLDGKFSIEVTGKDEIEISYIGYKTQTIEVGDLGILNVKMEGIMKFWTKSLSLVPVLRRKYLLPVRLRQRKVYS